MDDVLIDDVCAVYVKIDPAGYVLAINSSAFLTDPTDWVKIDEGTGDKYHHAQGNYLPMPLFTDIGAYRYKLQDGVVVECTAEEIAEQEAALIPGSTAPTDGGVWDELDAAYREGVDSV